MHGYAEVRLDVVWAVVVGACRPYLQRWLLACRPKETLKAWPMTMARMMESELDANWIAAIGTAIAAIAAGLSFWAACTARQIGKDAVAATKQQTETATVHDLLNHYAGPEMYRALHQFGRFVVDDPDHQARFRRITDIFIMKGCRLDAKAAQEEELQWAVDAIERDAELGDARRRIHHHFKRVWALRHANILSDASLLLLTSANAGWYCWRNEVLPVTLALGLRQQAKGRHPVATGGWAYELLDEVEKGQEASRVLPISSLS